MDENIIVNSGGKSFKIEPKRKIVADLQKKAIETTLKLLDSQNIDHIIYIDDKFDIEGQKGEFVGRVKSLKAQQKYISENEFEQFNWDGPDELINKLWESSEDKSRLLKILFKYFDDGEPTNLIPALEVLEYFGDYIKPFTPDQWIENEFNLIKNLRPDKKALCLFDFHFQTGNKLFQGKNGVQLAKILLEKDDLKDKVICGVFSSKFSEADEDSKRDEFARDYDLNKNSFYTISKYRNYFDPSIAGFSEGIKNLLLQPHVETLKGEAGIVLKESNKKAWRRIDEITPKTFNQIIQKSSLKEGVWEVSTLFRLYGILSKEENYNRIADASVRQNFNDSIKKIREIDLQDTGYKSTVSNQQLIDIRNSELYLNGTVINKLHLPLTNGDIFEIKGNEYMLLVQPCNLALRAKDHNCGKRDYSYNAGMLIPLKHFPKDKLNITAEVVKIAESSEKFYVAYFPSFKIVSLDFLDLSIFNDDGKALINFGFPILDNELVHFPWLKRYEYIYKSLLPFEKKIVEFSTIKKTVNTTIIAKQESTNEADDPQKDKIKEEIRILKEHLSNTEKNISIVEDLRKFKIDCTKIYNPQSRILDTGIKRVRHYKSPYSDDLLQKFMLYLSRNAFEHDFTN
jgi:hypothetical protein